MRSAFTARLLFVVLVMCLVATRSASASGTITLMWDLNSDPSVVGYMVHVGTQSGVYSQTHDVGNTNTFVLQNAVAGQRYFFAVSAYAAGPLVGPRSSEISGYSNAPPLLVHPGNQSSVVGSPVTLQLQGSDPYGEPVAYGVSGLPPGLALTTSTGFIQGAGTTAGVFPVTAWVTDGVLSAESTFTWTMTAPGAEPPPSTQPPANSPDTTPPSLTVTSPSAATSFTSSLALLTLAGTASDNVGVTMVSWVNDRGGSGVATGATNWSAGIPLQLGANTITVTAHDAAGNKASVSVTVTYIDSDAPVVTLASPATLTNVRTYDAQVTLGGTASDNVGVARVTWVADSGLSGVASGTTKWTVGPLPLEPGTTRVLVSAEDAAGNRGSLLVTVNRLVATEPSTVIATSPDGDTYELLDPARPTITGTSVITLPGLEEPPATSESTNTPALAPQTLAPPAASTTDVLRVAMPRQGSTAPTTSTATTTLIRSSRTALIAPAPVDTTTATVAPVPVVQLPDLSAPLSPAAPEESESAADTNAPKVTITSPTDGVAYGTSDATVFLVGIAVDDVGVARVSWTTNRGAIGTAEGTSVWSAEVPLEHGENVITVTARDAAGNIARAAITVVRSN